MKKTNSREKIIIRAGIIGVFANIGLAAIKIVIGSFAGSVAIVSDAINNISDAASSVITILGSKLAAKDPDDKHPYGYGRIEYITALVISVVIIVVGIEFLQTSFKAIFNPKPVDFTWIAIIIMLITVFAKIILSSFNKKAGMEALSPALIASGTEALGDAAVTTITVMAAIISLFSNIHLDGYAGILVSVFILYSGMRLVFETFNDIIGKRADKDLAYEIYEEIEKSKMIKGAYDLILHNYGPNRYLGSVNVELEDFRTVQEATEHIMPIQEKIGEKFGIFLVFGFYPVNTTDEKVIDARSKILSIVKNYQEIKNMHAFFIDEERKILQFDIIVTFQVKDTKQLLEDITGDIEQEYPHYKVHMNIDHRYS